MPITATSGKTRFTPRTPEQARQWLRDNGISVSQFARDNGVSRDVVENLLRGRARGNFGTTHHAAVALGLKAPPDNATNQQNHT
jgi:gp16 family phage-associated protein